MSYTQDIMLQYFEKALIISYEFILGTANIEVFLPKIHYCKVINNSQYKMLYQYDDQTEEQQQLLQTKP